jgi:hypothetical protein
MPRYYICHVFYFICIYKRYDRAGYDFYYRALEKGLLPAIFDGFATAPLHLMN